MSALQVLEGLTVTVAEVVQDYFQLEFGSTIGLTIYNPVRIEPPTPIDALVGKKVQSMTESGKSIDIRFDDESSLTIDMQDEAYAGPEALVLHREGFPTVVWN